MLFKKRTIQSNLTMQEFAARLTTSDLFVGTVGETYFEIREEKIFSNKLLFPIINGQMAKQRDTTNTTISFSISKADKIGIGAFSILVLLLSVVLGVVSHDSVLLFVVLLWDIVILIIFMVIYVSNCRRALRKILKLTNSKITE